MSLIGKKCMLLPGLLLTAPNVRITDEDMNHEEIHVAQMKELLYIFFYLLYLMEWMVRSLYFSIQWLIGKRDDEMSVSRTAYRSISFEREAYQNEDNSSYLESRKSFAFLRYLKH